MDPITRLLMQGAAGASKKLYVEDVFSTWLYTGNGSTQTITNGIDLSGKGGLVWIKRRDTTYSHHLFDTARGADKALLTNSTSAQGSGWSTSFLSNGFSTADFIDNAATFASWTFRKAAKFFDVVTYVGDGNASKTISHNLGSTPGFLIVKRTDSTGQWQCYHRGLTSTNYYIQLNQTSAQQTLGSQVWGVSSTNFTVYGAATDTNINGAIYVAYLFAHDAGGFGDSGNDSVVKCGTFTCDGSGNVGTVDLGWEPQWILTKKTNGTQSWYQWDNMRGWALTTSSTLSPNLSDAEVAMGGTSYLYPTATGFAGSGNFFGPNAQVIYIAIRRGPMKTPTDATKVFEAKKNITSSSPFSLTGPPYVDFIIDKRNELVGDPTAETRLLGATRLFTNLTNAESAGSANWGGATGTQNITPYNTGDNHVAYLFRRAPGFFDVVAYDGGGTSKNHNLGVKPELAFIKVRSTSFRNWIAAVQGGTGGYLNTSDPINVSNLFIDLANATTTTFPVNGNPEVGQSGQTYIAYLFATLAGISKVGSYTGTGTTQQINCGFTAGARFVLIKRTDSTGDWYVWDSARGIVAGNDPYLLLNSTAAEVTGTDYVDTFSSGFEISSTAPAAINANGGSFIFLAIA